VWSPNQALLLAPSAGSSGQTAHQPELLTDGVVDEILISLVPILLGGGPRCSTDRYHSEAGHRPASLHLLEDL
jgi:riboflavin biosynthesis pyrimidine reductase